MVFKIARITFSSDLRKPCWITGKSLSPKFKKCPVLGETHIYMESFEIRAISTSPHPPLMWKRFVDTFVVMKKIHNEEFLTHLNSVAKNIQFTNEESRPDGSMPFLDILVTPGTDGRLNTTVYRKPTHTDQYMHWDSHHTVSSKYSVVGTLHHRAKTLCSSKQLLQQEEEHLSKVLMNCKYPTWALNRVKMKMSKPAQNKNNKKSTTSQNTNQRPYITVPYYKGLSESVNKKCNNYGYKSISKEVQPSKTSWWPPRTKILC